MFLPSSNALIASHGNAAANGWVPAMNRASQMAGNGVGFQCSAAHIGTSCAKHDHLMLPKWLHKMRRNADGVIDFGPMKRNTVRHAADTATKARIGHGSDCTLHVHEKSIFFSQFNCLTIAHCPCYLDVHVSTQIILYYLFCSRSNRWKPFVSNHGPNYSHCIEQ